jgi:hypothetical protein
LKRRLRVGGRQTLERIATGTADEVVNVLRIALDQETGELASLVAVVKRGHRTRRWIDRAAGRCGVRVGFHAVRAEQGVGSVIPRRL